MHCSFTVSLAVAEYFAELVIIANLARSLASYTPLSTKLAVVRAIKFCGVSLLKFGDVTPPGCPAVPFVLACFMSRASAHKVNDSRQ